jgi:hypothetical protein
LSSRGPFPGRGHSHDTPHRGVAPSVSGQSAVAPVDYDSLPPPNARWIPRRKAELLTALSRGLIGVEEACARYDLSPEELASWQHAVKRDGGLAALKITRLVRHRRDYLEGA